MAKSNRIFVGFAVEDKTYRDFLVGQAKNKKSPFEFVDMSAKEPWDEKWKTNCRIRVKGCDGVIALVSKNTAKAEGTLVARRALIVGINTYGGGNDLHACVADAKAMNESSRVTRMARRTSTAWCCWIEWGTAPRSRVRSCGRR